MKKKIPDKNEPIKKRPSWKWRLIGFFLSLFFIAGAVVAGWVLIVFLQMPSLDSMLHETRAPIITFLDNNGREIRSDNKIMGSPVSVDSLPAHVWQAVISIEDKRFFSHGSIDYRALLRAMVNNIRSGKIAMGGSTITQQTAKNIFLSREKTATRKIQELIISVWLEKRFSKKQILDLYLNRVTLVRDLRGIDAAARELFGVPATQLSIAQGAQIAAMLKAPTTYSALLNPEKNIARARIVLSEMVRQKYITLDMGRVAAAELKPAVRDKTNKNITRYWTDFVREELGSRFGGANSDLKVYTTLDTKLQERIAVIVGDKIAKSDDKKVGQGAVVVLDRDGAIVAMVGGADYGQSQFNRALAYRQPGSAFKPIVYLVALEHGMTPQSYVNDSRFAIGDYNPRNYNEKYYGDISLAAAFAKSVNSVPLKLTEQFGIDEVLNMAGRLGVGAKLKREYSTVLGASEMTLLDLTTMNAVIWNNGQSVRPYSIEKITDSSGKVLYRRNPSDALQLLSPETVAFMQQLLYDVIESGGTGGRANINGVLGGKTGTSNDNRDAWFVGATGDYVFGVWAGNDDFSPMDKSVTGGTIPAEIFREAARN